MHRLAALVATVLALALVLVSGSRAGPEKIAFPANWKSYVLYATVDRPDIQQHRELYASSPEAVQAMKEGRPLPHGTVLFMVQYKVTTGTPQRGPVLTKGQSYAHAFAAPGLYDYICGLHPTMKGQIEVK